MSIIEVETTSETETAYEHLKRLVRLSILTIVSVSVAVAGLLLTYWAQPEAHGPNPPFWRIVGREAGLALAVTGLVGILADVLAKKMLVKDFRDAVRNALGRELHDAKLVEYLKERDGNEPEARAILVRWREEDISSQRLPKLFSLTAEVLYGTWERLKLNVTVLPCVSTPENGESVLMRPWMDGQRLRPGDPLPAYWVNLTIDVTETAFGEAVEIAHYKSSFDTSQVTDFFYWVTDKEVVDMVEDKCLTLGPSGPKAGVVDLFEVDELTVEDGTPNPKVSNSEELTLEPEALSRERVQLETPSGTPVTIRAKLWFLIPAKNPTLAFQFKRKVIPSATLDIDVANVTDINGVTTRRTFPFDETGVMKDTVDGYSARFSNEIVAPAFMTIMFNVD